MMAGMVVLLSTQGLKVMVMIFAIRKKSYYETRTSF
jgi:hypothetical protein